MIIRMPAPGLLLIVIVWVAVWFGLSAWAWGSWSGLVAHPARAGALLILVLMMVAALFTGANLSGFKQSGNVGKWIVAPICLFGLAVVGLPPYTDRHELWTLDGDAIRYFGLVLLAVGSVLRVGPMFALGDRFTWALARHEHHRLVSTGFYRFIRHPSYLGGLVGITGWALVCRSGPALLLVLLPLALLIIVFIPAEEATLVSEFGQDYLQYQRRTWRLLPFVY